jgi:hypothetical protein
MDDWAANQNVQINENIRKLPIVRCLAECRSGSPFDNRNMRKA